MRKRVCEWIKRYFSNTSFGFASKSFPLDKLIRNIYPLGKTRSMNTNTSLKKYTFVEEKAFNANKKYSIPKI